MIKINDAEEKKMIIAYQKLCSNKTAKNHLLCNSSVYSEWLVRWRNDFVVDGKCLKMWHQKFVVSANKHRQGIEPPYYHEYNAFVNDVTNWMNNNYEAKQGRKNNKRRYAEMLIDHRKSCADKVVAKLKECANLSDCKLIYKLPEKTDKRFTELMKYLLVRNEKTIFKGSFDEIIIYMKNADGFMKNKLEREDMTK